jgi:hypothetical protein
MHENLGQSRFEWQEKYGAFTVGLIAESNHGALYTKSEKAPRKNGLRAGMKKHIGATQLE